ncbi:hypothetical protein DDB_G0280327 [Dictyostelium discoideum AX4]|uniref:Uncharacterized protein n=1 Tax=Dictyostelium discoideum TaxID=44689 RepID=Q54VH8_DICDI|nr:hypothetical protein DDB_G0280327 [Dictyostelium discoideum AX4]EAL67390.2 hypothetical protein DDB_G0280327 [Dictyostelium discoideum AX4]|eukprot:XP_641377.2 hypothetical protein DDB_G0280327 [Dictyostelium discoideum AX4]
MKPTVQSPNGSGKNKFVIYSKPTTTNTISAPSPFNTGRGFSL